jgi:FSR family fosmidomycin resistance protein-like MFS transporter
MGHHGRMPDPATIVSPPAPAGPGSAVDVRPRVTLGLISAQHALIHAQTALLPLVFLPVIAAYGVGVESVAFLLAASNLLAGVAQLAYGPLTRVISRRSILGVGGLVFGAGMSAMALATSWATFSVATIVGRVGGSPQHPVGNALLAEQYPAERRGFAISTHIGIGNLGTVAVPLVGGAVIATAGWQPAVLLVGIPALVVAVLILAFVRETGADRRIAIAHGSTRAAYRAVARERDLRWLFAASSVAAAGRGLGIVTTFVPLYLSRVLGLDTMTVTLMYTLLLVGSVPAPIVAGRVSDRLGHRRVLVVSYVLGAASLALFVVAGDRIPLVWLAIGFMSAFVFEESALLQALLADVAPTPIRDVAFSAYFTLMFGVGAVWAAVMGAIVGVLGDAAGFPVAFLVMAASFLLAAVVILPIRAGRAPGGSAAGVPPVPAPSPAAAPSPD